MSSLVHLPAFLLASLLLIITPGPATFFVGERASRSRRLAARAVAGIVLGDLSLIALSALGVATMLLRWPALQTGLQLLGAGYLAYLAWGLLRAASPASAAPAETPMDASFRQGYLLTLINPKPVLFFAAFFPQFLNAPAARLEPGFAVLALLFEAINLCYFAMLILLAHRLGQGRLAQAMARWRVSQLAGIVLLLCAASLAAARLA
ncbi:LysE family translocator [Chromobacterium sp. IIBBL 290-4]|uniref:LysE family translocator n=1 Tax=Chromobacterium sp. IIBBL 290-4 TaxID=2953890 RepID=UPI0020B7FC11|nr:LysE family transporter [Chromobacterium sp. IIBBL 290-4]UTH76400.1 LysE family transporter [Chromobacterium sp. IIBBL 290-4]